MANFQNRRGTVGIPLYSSYDPADDDELEANETQGNNDNSSEDLPDVSQQTPIEKFRRIVRGVCTQYRWTRAMEKKIVDQNELDEEKKREKEREKAGISTFNPQFYKAHVHSQGNLTTKAKLLLTKPSWDRCENEVDFIYKIVNHLTAFSRYEKTVKRELAKVLYYECFEDGRIILQQGHHGLSFYFIVKGSVLVEISSVDKRSGRTYKRVVNEIMAGDSFGEMALLHDTKRTATIICKGTTEFLRVDKPDFDQVLKVSYQQEWEKRMTFLKSCPLFTDWSHRDLKTVNATSRVTSYAPNSVIISDLRQPSDHLYVVVAGNCSIVRHLDIVAEKLPFDATKLCLPAVKKNGSIASNIQLNRNANRKKLILLIHKLHPGDFFGYGENLGKVSIISEDQAEILAVPKANFTRCHREQFARAVKRASCSTCPSRSKTFQLYLTEKRWKEYKSSLTKSLTKRNSPSFNNNRFNTSSCKSQPMAR